MTRLYLQARIMATLLPKSETGASWKNKCGAAVNTLGERAAARWLPSVVGPSVNKNVRPASKIISTDSSKAPAGAQHWWSGGTNNDGHVTTDLLGGGQVCFMASGTLAEQWQPYLGVNSVSKYSAAHKELTYLGWSLDYAGATYTPADVAYVDWWDWQGRLKYYGYDGPVDGIPGPKTLTALKRYLAAQVGYSGPIDGTFDKAALAAFDQLTHQIPEPPVAPEPEPPKEEPVPTQPKEPEIPPTPPELVAPQVPDLPDVIIPARGRSILYLVNWIAGVVISAAVAGWLATSIAPPTWLLVTVAVYSSASSSVSLIARANVPK